jgi:hypothetical protein
MGMVMHACIQVVPGPFTFKVSNIRPSEALTHVISSPPLC